MKAKLLKISIILTILAVLLCGCIPDLGEFDDLDDYYDAFDDIYLIVDSTDISAYDMEDFYDAETVNNFECVEEQSNRYKYLVVEADRDMVVDSFTLWMYTSDETTSVSVSAFIIDEFPFPIDFSFRDILYGDFVATLGGTEYVFSFNGRSSMISKGTVTCGSKTAEYKFDEFNYTTEFSWKDDSIPELGEVTLQYYCTLNKDDYDSLTITEYTILSDGEKYISMIPTVFTYREPTSDEGPTIGTGGTTLQSGVWGSFTIDDWTPNGTEKERTFELSDGDFLVIKIKNNCMGSNRSRLNSVSLKLTNIMIRIV